MSDQENASVREWTDLLGRLRFGSVRVAGRNVRGAAIKAVGLRLATYADSDGSATRPGLPRLAVDMEMDHKTVKMAMQVYVRFGLLRLVRTGSRPGTADEWQLTIPGDLLDRTDLEVWSPAQQRLEIERVRASTRGKHSPREPKSDLQGRTAPADADTCRGVRPPQTPDLQGRTAPADTLQATRPAGAVCPADTRPAGAYGPNLQGPYAPATYQRPRHNYDLPTAEKTRTALTGPRATAPEDQIFSAVVDDPELAAQPLPDHCPHGLTSRQRSDGTPSCALCRRGAPAGQLATVTALPRRTA